MENTHPNEQQTEEILGIQGYKFLGWMNGWKHVYFDEDGNVTEDKDKRRTFGYTKEDHPEYGTCTEQKHELRSKQHNSRGSNVTDWCDTCKHYWKTDMSD